MLKVRITSRFVLWMLSVGMMFLGVGMVFGQDYPNKPIRIVTAEIGGSNDFTARIIAQGLTETLGSQVIVDNRGGANGIIAIQTVAKARPDGYTLLFHSSALWTLPLIQTVPYDPVRDILPISLATRSPLVLVVNSSVQANSVKDLIALAKSKPGKLNYASGVTGSTNHLAAEMFKAMADVDIVRINYKGSAQALNALMGAQVELMFSQAATVAPHVKSGRLRSLAVTSAQPSALLPNLLTLAASGLPNYEVVAIVGAFAPPGTSATLINRLNQEIVRVLNRAEVRERFFKAGVETVGSSPEQFATTIKSDMARLGKVIKDASIREE